MANASAVDPEEEEMGCGRLEVPGDGLVDVLTLGHAGKAPCSYVRSRNL